MITQASHVKAVIIHKDSSLSVCVNNKKTVFFCDRRNKKKIFLLHQIDRIHPTPSYATLNQ